MSKMENLRAMREARFQEAASRAAKPTVNIVRSERRAPLSSDSRPAPADKNEAPKTAACGHRSINGRSCTRDQGHASKSHRYS
jgi:hypothetical protein